MSTAFHHLLVASFIVSCTFSFTFITIISLVAIISSRFHCLLVTSFQQLHVLFLQLHCHCTALPSKNASSRNKFLHLPRTFSSLVSSSNTIFSLFWHLLQIFFSYNNFFIFSKLSIVGVASYWSYLLELLATTTLQVATFHYR
jgi:hypothetical protein